MGRFTGDREDYGPRGAPSRELARRGGGYGLGRELGGLIGGGRGGY